MPMPSAASAAAVTLVLLAGGGCAQGGPMAQLPALRPAQLAASAAPAGAAAAADPVSLAIGVVRRYFGALDGLRRRMRAAPLGRLLTANCPCRSQVRAIRAARRRHERYTDRIRLLSLIAHLDRADLVDVVVSLDVTHAGLVGPDGLPIRRPRTWRNLHRELLLRRIGDEWLIDRVLAV